MWNCTFFRAYDECMLYLYAHMAQPTTCTVHVMVQPGAAALSLKCEHVGACRAGTRAHRICQTRTAKPANDDDDVSVFLFFAQMRFSGYRRNEHVPSIWKFHFLHTANGTAVCALQCCSDRVVKNDKCAELKCLLARSMRACMHH